MITRFDSIKNHKVFQDFRWSTALSNFSRFNLIYGDNGTGKTTLANLFRVMEKGWERQLNILLNSAPCRLKALGCE
jgi:wobble nucleotide-excising tRNase